MSITKFLFRHLAAAETEQKYDALLREYNDLYNSAQRSHALSAKAEIQMAELNIDLGQRDKQLAILAEQLKPLEGIRKAQDRIVEYLRKYGDEWFQVQGATRPSIADVVIARLTELESLAGERAACGTWKPSPTEAGRVM